MKTCFEIVEFEVNDIITTSSVIEWDDGNITPPTKED